MRSTSAAASIASPKFDRPIEPATDQMVENVLSDIAKTLWPTNTAPNIAIEINKMRGKGDDECAVRTVERYLGGQREWSGEAIAIIVAEIMRRHAMRNVRVTARK